MHRKEDSDERRKGMADVMWKTTEKKKEHAVCNSKHVKLARGTRWSVKGGTTAS